MLTPEYLWSVADPVVNIWEELDSWAIKDICERLMAAELYDYNKLPGTARYRAWLLNQSGMHYEEMIRIIAKLTKKSEKEVKHLFEEAGLLSLENDRPIYENRGLPLTDIRNNSGLLQILNEAYQRTNGELKNYTRTTLRNSRKQIYDSLDKAYMAVATGTRSYSEVIRETVEDLSKDSTTVTYPSGHKDKIDVAVRRAVLTGINQGAAMISLENALQNGYEYLIIDAHIGARVNDNDKIANHAGWQGKIFKIIGSTEEYGNITEETGFPGNPLGLCGYNCRHHFFPHILGDPNPFERNIPDEKENRKVYESSQKQRYMERKIRETKRNLLGLETCIKNCPDEKAKFDLQIEYDKKSAKLQKQNKAYREFCKANGLQTEDERLKPAQWDRNNADHARSAAKRYQNARDSKTEFRIKNSTTGQNTVKERLNVNTAYDMVPPKVQKAINSGTTIEVGKSGASQYDYRSDTVYAAKGARTEDIIHEFGHLVENKLLDRDIVRQIRRDIIGTVNILDIETEVFYDALGQPREVFILKKPLFISDYQGRIYVDNILDAFDESGSFIDDYLYEFVSEAFRAYIMEPEVLKQKSIQLYNMIKEAVT